MPRKTVPQKSDDLHGHHIQRSNPLDWTQLIIIMVACFVVVLTLMTSIVLALLKCQDAIASVCWMTGTLCVGVGANSIFKKVFP